MKAQYGPPVKRKIPFYVNADESPGESGFGGRRLLSNGKGVRRAGGAAGECSSTGKVEQAKEERLAGKHGTLQGFWSHHMGRAGRDESKWNVAEMEQRGRRRTERREAGQNGMQLVSRSNRKPLACLRRRWTEAQRISTEATKQIQVAKHDPASSGLRVPVPKDPSVCNLNPMTPNSIVQSCRHNNHRHPKRNVETRCRSTRGR
jgi:hypothetical protein